MWRSGESGRIANRAVRPAQSGRKCMLELAGVVAPAVLCTNGVRVEGLLIAGNGVLCLCLLCSVSKQ